MKIEIGWGKIIIKTTNLKIKQKEKQKLSKENQLLMWNIDLKPFAKFKPSDVDQKKTIQPKFQDHLITAK